MLKNGDKNKKKEQRNVGFVIECWWKSAYLLISTFNLYTLIKM